AVVAGDAARLPGSLHDAVAGALDRVGGTDLGARRRIAVHADDRHGLYGNRAVDILEMDHRRAAMRVALAAGRHARLAADAAIGVDEELVHARPPDRGQKAEGRRQKLASGFTSALCLL